MPFKEKTNRHSKVKRKSRREWIFGWDDAREKGRKITGVNPLGETGKKGKKKGKINSTMNTML
ncbi:MAG: hypothetical protein WC408_00020 [Candidatus Micrarchaeia archaeon]